MNNKFSKIQEKERYSWVLSKTENVITFTEFSKFINEPWIAQDQLSIQDESNIRQREG